MTGESWGPDTPGWHSLMKFYECLESPYSRLAKDDPQGRLDQQGDLEKEVLSLIFEEQRSDSLHANLSRATRAAAQVRDRLSTRSAAHREPDGQYRSRLRTASPGAMFRRRTRLLF